MALSNTAALHYTHQLRAAHDVILVGIGTVLSDNPRLTVRHAEGPHPQPLVLDSQLRMPLHAALWQHPTHSVWIATTTQAATDQRERLEQAGARLWTFDPGPDGRVPLGDLLAQLARAGLRRVMVEGGARILAAFLAARLADRLSVTIAPRFIGGARLLPHPLDLRLREVAYQILEDNVIVEGTPAWA